jgi:XTP/dITP diphosphohydrolase
MSIELILATGNLHKVREYREMLNHIDGLEVLSLLDFPNYTAPEETGTTFEENALLKAEHACEELQKCVIADDSGLVVPFLNDAPGVYSARYAGKNCTDADNRKKLLEALRDKGEENRSAYFMCCIALVMPDQQSQCVNGICEGRITDEERGGNGFGYDPLFIKNGYTKTFAELSETTKNRVSHRRKAFDKFSLLIEPLMKP